MPIPLLRRAAPPNPAGLAAGLAASPPETRRAISPDAPRDAHGRSGPRHPPLAAAFRRLGLLPALVSLLLLGCASRGDTTATTTSAASRPPNIVVILADDLGVGELGCYGQRTIRTPSLDSLAAEGVRHTNAYAGSCVCAPSRCTILTGLHTGHAAIRDNRELAPTGQEPLPASATTLATLLQARGYATAAIGKWGLGVPGSSGDPLSHGFDLFFGYYCQRHAHNHCPTHLFRNGQRIDLPTNRDRWPSGEVPPDAAYAPDLFREEALAFVREHHDRPFFLFLATTVPHAALQVPADSLAEYGASLDERPYDGSKGYLAHPTPRAAYAAMVTRLDRDIGSLLRTLDELGLDENTIVLFTSDNGPTFNGGTDSAFFESATGRRGLKCQLYEGGIRVPLLVRWPAVIAPGSSRDEVTVSWDLFPTLAAAAGCSPDEIAAARGDAALPLDGISLLPLWRGEAPAERPAPLYWEYASSGGSQAVRIGSMKGVRTNVKRSPQRRLELYDLSVDPNETTNVVDRYPELEARMLAIMDGRTPDVIPSRIVEWNLAPR